jgi:probable F420-dependent oxidoreductase
MKFGIAVRSMGPQSRPDILTGCVDVAEQVGLDDIWVQDHLAIPPDDAEGSGGRYLDPLATLAFLAARTTRIGLGTGVLNLPYRSALPTVKSLATIQELSEGRLRVGVGLGWMKAEFRALGVDRNRRGRLADEALDLLHRCFENDEVEANGQKFLFLPRPQRPPIYIGGAAPHALERVARSGDGWMPMGGDPEQLEDAVAQLRELMSEHGRPAPEVVLLTALPIQDESRTRQQVERLGSIGVTAVIHGLRYTDTSEFARSAEQLANCVEPLRDLQA